MAYNSQFDLRGKKIEDTYTQVVQYDTSSGYSYTGQGLQLDLSSSYTVTSISSSFAEQANTAFNATNSFTADSATSASYTETSVSSSYVSGTLDGVMLTNGIITPFGYTIINSTGQLYVTAGPYSGNILRSSAGSRKWASTGNSFQSNDGLLFDINGNIILSASVFTATGSLEGTASFATSASWAPGGGSSTSASWASQSLSSSYSPNQLPDITDNGTAVDINTAYTRLNSTTSSLLGYFQLGRIGLSYGDSGILGSIGGNPIIEIQSVPNTIIFNDLTYLSSKAWAIDGGPGDLYLSGSIYYSDAPYNDYIIKSASLAQNAISASWAPAGSSLSSSWASSSISASHAVIADAAYNISTPNHSVFIGELAGNGTSVFNSVFIGPNAGYLGTSAGQSIMIGNSAGFSATNGLGDVYIGVFAGNSATNAQYSNFIGWYAGNGATNAGSSTFIGYQAGYNDTLNDSGNNGAILIGNYTNTGGWPDTIAIGSATKPFASGSMNLGNVIYATNTSSGSVADTTSSINAKVGIGTTNITDRLTVAGNISCSVVTASLFNTVSSSLAPLNQTTASAWMPIIVNGQTFYLPLYQ